MLQNRNYIKNLLGLVKEQVEIIVAQKDEIPQLYIDMAKENLIKLYEEIHRLEKAKSNSLIKDLPGLKKERNFQESIESKNDKLKDIVETLSVKEEIQTESPKEAKQNQELNPTIKKETPTPTVETIQAEKVIPTPKEKTEKKIVQKKEDKATKVSNDLFESQLSIGEKLQAQQEPAVVDKFKDHQIKDIKSAIGINEKFLFINELFDGNLNKYNQSLEKLDLAEHKIQANQILQELEQELSWDKESDALKQLLTFIDRRY